MPMYSKRRQSSANSDELTSRYEFVDYTSVSPFEKFVTHIEETLYSWGVKDGSYGIFCQQQLNNAKAAIANPSAVEYTRKETLSMSDDVYQLTYHYHPTTTTTTAAVQPLTADHFYQYSSQYHPLHRWTGQDRIIVIRPMQDSLKNKIFNTTGKSSVHMALAKHLISACAIAFQNTGCKVPVFVPVGQSRHDMYVGLMVRAGQHESDQDNALKDTEIRYTMTLTTPPTSEFSDLDGLKALFLQKLNVHREDYGLPPTNESNMFISAVYTYNLKNWFDENWKEWDDISQVKRKLSFSDDFESWGDDDEEDCTIPGSSFDKRIIDKRVQLSFGAFNDPLRSLTLSALFPLASEEQFHKSYDRNMDALTAKQWQLSREFAPTNQQRAYLSTLIEQVIDSWVKDPSNREYLAPYDDSNDDSTSDGVGLMRNLFTAGLNNNKLASSDISSNNGGDSVAVIKSEQVEQVLICLFHPMHKVKKLHEDQTFNNTKELGLRLRLNSSVPYRSFLWNLLLYSLEAASNSTSGDKKQQNVTHFMAFFRVIWLEVLKQIRWHWENSIPIPGLDPRLYDDSSSKKDHKKTLGIDLRYNMLHQKISMINCCIHRRLQNAPQHGNPETLNPVRHVGDLFDLIPSQEDIKKESTASKFQSLIERFVEGDTETNQIKDLKESVSFQPSDSEDDSDVFVDANEDSDINEDENQEVIVPEDPMQESFLASLPYIPGTAEEIEQDEANAVQDPDASEGYLHFHETLTLLKTGKVMKIPITQDPGFMTEDMISEQADAFEKLGTSEKATQQRARLQSAQLYSDMQAFKAANPHACLEDFVRWHSPRDWIADEEGGHLSTRMSEPKNIWQDLWKCSKRIPSKKQRPLFNVAVEAEKALYFLETTSVHEFMSLMLPTLSLIAYDTLASHPITRYSQHVSKGLTGLGNDLVNFPWHDFRHGKITFDHILTNIRELESIMCHSISLLRKLPKQYDLADQLLISDHAIVKEGNERSAVFQLFKNDQGIISQPSYREYLLYSNCQDLTSNNRVLPQRQYTIIKDNEIRMMDMQTTDALYY